MSCHDDDVLTNIDQEGSFPKNSYSIPVDSALNYLYEFINEPSSNSSARVVSKRVVKSLIPIKLNGNKASLINNGKMFLSSQENSNDDENLVYIANFDNDQGYAILAADKRIGENVIAITDAGSLSDSTVYSALELLNSERIILDEYPKTGPGFFTMPETGDELFLNPNTVTLYDDKEKDTLVGFYSFDNEGEEDENGNLIPQDQTSNLEPEALTSAMCVSYAMNKIKGFTEQEEFQNDPNDGTGNPYTKKYIVSAWEIKKSVSPMFTQFKEWRQNSPFNDLCPKRRKYVLVGHKRRAPAGCFPLAISKIMTYFEHPKNFVYNGYKVDWKELKKSVETDIGKNSAAHLLRSVGSSCDSWYFYNGTFTFPHKATSYMRHIGFTNAHSYSYKFDRVTNMLDNGKPVIIYSVPGINIFKSHCWNIDGYKVKERTVTTNIYFGSTIINTTNRTETVKMVHCDFGWKGRCNGYYVSGVFKLNDSNVEHDPGTPYGGSTNYNNLLKVITYDINI